MDSIFLNQLTTLKKLSNGYTSVTCSNKRAKWCCNDFRYVVSTFLDIYIERDLQNGTITEEEAQELWTIS